MCVCLCVFLCLCLSVRLCYSVCPSIACVSKTSRAQPFFLWSISTYISLSRYPISVAVSLVLLLDVYLLFFHFAPKFSLTNGFFVFVFPFFFFRETVWSFSAVLIQFVWVCLSVAPVYAACVCLTAYQALQYRPKLLQNYIETLCYIWSNSNSFYNTFLDVVLLYQTQFRRADFVIVFHSYSNAVFLNLILIHQHFDKNKIYQKLSQVVSLFLFIFYFLWYASNFTPLIELESLY